MRIFPLGASALTVEFGNEISPVLNSKAISLARAISNSPFKGMIEAAAAYSSVTVYYDVRRVLAVGHGCSTAFEIARSAVLKTLENLKPDGEIHGREFDIPVRFGDGFSPDLPSIANTKRLDESEVIEIFLSRKYRVYMLGFLPGFAYMGEVDERIAVPRLDAPRTRVEAGSVGIADRQTGIYPLASPGGWQIIGRTDTKLFDPSAESPCLLQAGDTVRFTCSR